jgi:hypothetical protein
MNEKRLLQLAVALGACVPVFAGTAGAIVGAELFGLSPSSSGDSHVRYLSVLLLGIGLAFWSTIPRIEQHTARIRLLTGIVVLGGLVRLAALLAAGQVAPAILFALAMELAVTPALCRWQARIAQKAVKTV